MSVADILREMEEAERPSLGFTGYVKDIGKGVIDGAFDAVEEIHELGHAAINWLDNKANLNLIDDEFRRWLPDINLDSAAGELASGITKFAVGMIGAGKFLKGAKILQGSSKAVKIARALVQGALTDFTMNRPGEERLSNLIEKFPALENHITRYLAADEDEGLVEGKLKATLEGMLVSGVTDLFLNSLKFYKQAAKAAQAGNTKQAQQILDTAAESLFDDLTKAVDPTGLKVFDPATNKVGTIVDLTDDGAFNVVFKNAETGEFVEEVLTKEHVKVVPKSHQMTDDDIFERLGLKAKAADKAPAPTLSLEDHQRASIDAIKKNIRANLEDPDWFAEGRTPGGVVNYDYFDGPEDAAKVIKAYEDASLEALKERVGTESWQDVMVKSYNYMEEVLGEPGSFISTLKDLGDNSLGLAHKAYGIGSLIADLSNEVAEISKQVLNPETSTPALKLKLLHRIQLMDASLQHYKAIKTGVARALNSFKIPLRVNDQLNLEQLNGVLDEFGGQKFIDSLAARFANMSPKDASKLVAATKGNIFWAVNNELWINNVLSGVKTQAANAVSTMANAAMYPLSKIAGGVVTADKDMVVEGARMFYAYGKFFTENVRMMAKAFKYGTNFLDADASVFDKPARAISSDFLRIGNPFAAKFVDTIGTIINLPSRGLMSVDEFFKHMVYRAELYGSLFSKGHQMGLTGDALEEFVNKGLQQAFTVVKVKNPHLPEGFEEVLGKAVFANAKAVAEEVTFTTPLVPGSLSYDLSRLAMAHPYLRMIIPFIKTPVNVIKTAGQYTPGINMLMPSFRKALEAGGRERAVALGKMTVGAGLWATALVQAGQGKITGGGPKDPNKRAMLYEAGWQPYSFVVTDANGKKRYISFQRLEPFANFFGIVGDLKDISSQLSDDQLLDVSLAMMSSLARNLTSKTYLRGLSEALDALNDPDVGMSKWLKQQASAYVPLSGLLNDFTRGLDDELHEVEGLIDHLKSRIPGFSNTLPVKYSWVTGQPLKVQEGLGPDFASPFTTSEVKGWVQEELARLNYGFAPPSKEFRGVRLTPAQYSRLNQLHGTIRISGRTMLETLEAVMQSPAYDIKRERVDDSMRPDGVVDHRIAIIQRVIGAYRLAAIRQLLAEDEELRKAVYSERLENAVWKSGDPAKIEALEQLQEMVE